MLPRRASPASQVPPAKPELIFAQTLSFRAAKPAEGGESARNVACRSRRAAGGGSIELSGREAVRDGVSVVASKVGSWLGLIVAVAVACWCSGCGRPESGKAGEGGGRLFGVTFQTMNNPFFVDLNRGLKQVIEGRGDRLVTLDAQFNSLKQKNDIADLLQQRPAALFINPVNWEGVKGSLIEARRQGVPAIIVDAPVSDPDLVLCQVASDNIEAGRLACAALAEVNPKAKVVILHLSVNKACIDRVDGFRAEMSKHPEMKLLETQEGKGTTEGARPVMRDLLGRFPELDAVFPINDPSALGAISAIESAGLLGRVTVVTVDGSMEGVKAIKAGKLHSTSAQFPEEIGRVAAQAGYDHLAGKPVDKDIRIPVKLVTRTNAEEFLQAP
ncbi:MAG TPA: sugar ABC transporter substrate-binding protein [Verrucomicrobiota bacterium]|nr:sugar ABC transporter substrate-binding protein [Verrucomicrobiota bacterium]